MQKLRTDCLTRWPNTNRALTAPAAGFQHNTNTPVNEALLTALADWC